MRKRETLNDGNKNGKMIERQAAKKKDQVELIRIRRDLHSARRRTDGAQRSIREQEQGEMKGRETHEQER